MFRPIIEMIDLHASPGGDFRRAFARRWQREDEEVLIVRDSAMRTTASLRNSSIKRLAWGLSQRRVVERVVDLIGILTESAVQLFQPPRSVIPRINTLGDQTVTTGRLRVALKIVKKLLIGGPENALAGGAKARFCRRPRFLGNFTACEEGFEIGALKTPCRRPTLESEGVANTGVRIRERSSYKSGNWVDRT